MQKNSFNLSQNHKILSQEPEKAILVGVILPDQNEREVHEHLDELEFLAQTAGCLLYTSDAADERSSVDLGGRRIIKKKNTINNLCCHTNTYTT